jgi:NADH-ubiquinone oxidoreductase chain 4
MAHGFVSPALFILVGGVLYDRYHTRVISYYRGIGIFIPIFSTLFFIATACNIGVPISANWLGEFVTLAGIFERSPFISVLASSGIVLSAVYSI